MGKAAGGGADIETDQAFRIDVELIQRRRELHAAARHPGMIAAAHFDRRVVGKGLSGFVDAALGGEDEAGEDQCLCASAAFGKRSVDEKLIGAHLGHMRGTSDPGADRQTLDQAQSSRALRANISASAARRMAASGVTAFAAAEASDAARRM